MTQPSTKKPFTVAAMRHGGTHLITPVIRRLTNKPVYSPKGVASITCIPSEIVIIFSRDPRNRAVSNVRYKLGREAVEKLTAEERDEHLAAYLQTRKGEGGLTPIDFMLKWAGYWLNDRAPWDRSAREVFRCTFEELAGPLALSVVGNIAAFLEQAGVKLVATPEEAKAYTLGMSGTFTGRHSNYAEWFGPKSLAYWRSNFGPELTRRMGYQVREDLGI